jgi:ABC-type dipeptide/oligopeptide/nickel transport system permease subunit
MPSSAQQFLRRAWWMATSRAGDLLAVLGFNLCGDGVNDAPNLRHTRAGG